MKKYDIRNKIDELVKNGKISRADRESAEILANELPSGVILHFAGETPYIKDDEHGAIFYFNGDMEDWSYSNFSFDNLERATREQFVEECLYCLRGYIFNKNFAKVLPKVIEDTFNN